MNVETIGIKKEIVNVKHPDGLAKEIMEPTKVRSDERWALIGATGLANLIAKAVHPEYEGVASAICDAFGDTFPYEEIAADLIDTLTPYQLISTVSDTAKENANYYEVSRDEHVTDGCLKVQCIGEYIRPPKKRGQKARTVGKRFKVTHADENGNAYAEYEYDFTCDANGRISPRKYTFGGLWNVCAKALAKYANDESEEYTERTGNYTKVRYVKETYARGEVIARVIQSSEE